MVDLEGIKCSEGEGGDRRNGYDAYDHFGGDNDRDDNRHDDHPRHYDLFEHDHRGDSDDGRLSELTQPRTSLRRGASLAGRRWPSNSLAATIAQAALRGERWPFRGCRHRSFKARPRQVSRRALRMRPGREF